MSQKRDNEQAQLEEQQQAGKKQKTEGAGWVIPAKFAAVLEDLKSQPWKEGVTVQDLIGELIGKAETDAFFIAGMIIIPYTIL